MTIMTDKKPRITMVDVERFRAEYASVKDWLNNASRSQYTTLNYVRSLIDYCNWADLNPDELLAERRKDKTHEAERRLNRFIAESDLSHNLKWRIASAVKSFYKSNYEHLEPAAGKISMLRQKPIRTPEIHEIEAMIRDISLRDKAFILTLRDTGMREGSVSKLRWTHLWTELFDTKSGDLIWDHTTPVLIRLSARELKGRYPENQQICFLTPQTVELLLEYKSELEARLRRPVKRDDLIFVSDHSVKGEEGVFQPIGVKGAAYIVRGAARHIGKDYSPHDLRRFAQTAFERARIQPNWVRKLLGRKIRGEEDPYSRPKIDDLRQEFARAIPLISQTKTVEATSAEVEKLRAEVAALQQYKKIVDELKVKVEEFGRWKVRDYDTGEVIDQKTGEVMTFEEFEAKQLLSKRLKAAKTKTE